MVKTRIIPTQPALILEEKERHLVITDLHIGIESNLISNDIFIEPKDLVREMRDNIENLIQSEKADTLVLLGDIKSGIDTISKIEWNAVPLFFEIGKDVKTIVIPGNHDGNLQKLLPDYVTLTSSSGIVIGDVLLTHGHVMPSENLSDISKIVMGHAHPVYFQDGSVLDGQRVWVSIMTQKSQVFPSAKGNLEILVVPSFNKYLYASQKRYKKSSSPILMSIKDHQSAKIVTLDGSIIGNESMISNVL